MTAPDGGRRSALDCSIASRRDASISNTCRPGSEHVCVTCGHSLPRPFTMTPPNPSHRQNKIFAAAADGQPTAEQDTEHPDDHSDSDPESTVLAHTARLHDRIVYHEMGNDGQPICGITGDFTPVPRVDAREHTKGRCRHCTRIHTGESDHRSCPHCDQSIATSHWPQHVRKCGEPHQCTLQSDTFRGGGKL